MWYFSASTYNDLVPETVYYVINEQITDLFQKNSFYIDPKIYMIGPFFVLEIFLKWSQGYVWVGEKLIGHIDISLIRFEHVFWGYVVKKAI